MKRVNGQFRVFAKGGREDTGRDAQMCIRDRYYYHENVYRPSAESHTFKEISQMGLELLGAVGTC